MYFFFYEIKHSKKVNKKMKNKITSFNLLLNDN